MAIEEIQRTESAGSAGSESSASWQDALFGLANTYVGAKYSESTREQPEPANQAYGNTDVIHQPVKGQTQAGETILVKEGADYKKIGLYAGITFGSILVLAVAYKAVK